LIILSGIFVTLTFSRISILLVLGIVFVTLIYKLIKGKLFSFAPLLLVERFTNLISGNDTSWTDRVNLVKSSLSVIKNNLFFGTGLGNFTKGMENYIPNTVNGVLLIQPVHNVLLLMIAELGIVGSLLYVLLLGKVLVSNISKMNWFKWLVVLVLIVIGCFDHYLFSLPQGMVIGGILLLLLMSYKKCMQVYISGAHNTGKTYLIESLRESGSLPIVDEGVSEIMLSHGWTVRDLKKNKEVFMELQKEVLTSKIKQTFAEDSFLIDRSIFDPLVYAKTYLGEEGFISLLRYGESVGLKKSIQIMKRRILIVLSPEFELARIEANTPNSIKFSSGVSNEKKVFEDMCHYHRNLVDLLEQWHIPYHLISVLDIEERKLKLQGIIDRNVI